MASSRPARGAQAPPVPRGPAGNTLRAQIDQGRTGDKIPAQDPAAAPLGTDDEAAGHAPVASALPDETETTAAPPAPAAPSAPPGHARGEERPLVTVLAVGIVTAAAVFLGVLGIVVLVE